MNGTTLSWYYNIKVILVNGISALPEIGDEVRLLANNDLHIVEQINQDNGFLVASSISAPIREFILVRRGEVKIPNELSI